MFSALDAGYSQAYLEFYVPPEALERIASYERGRSLGMEAAVSILKHAGGDSNGTAVLGAVNTR
jgi:hypothetical protein